MIRVGLLGSSGLVGRTYLELLKDHPLFELAFTSTKPLSESDIARAHECECLFSALPSDVAAVWDTRFAQAGHIVISSAAVHRKNPHVPVVIPEINPHHLDIVDFNRGGIIAKPNCTVQSFLLPLFPIHRAFHVTKVIVTTFQAISGAGKHAPDMHDTVIPFIDGEEEKTEWEPRKILGIPCGDAIIPFDGITISAHCNRVPVSHGHLVCVSFACEKKPSEGEIREAWDAFDPTFYLEEKDRPQPRLDRDSGKGMRASLGRLRPCPVLDYRFVALTHNLVRGAAGGGLAIGEHIWSNAMHI